MYISKSEKGWGHATIITRTEKNGLLLSVQYHETVVAAFEWGYITLPSPHVAEVTIDTGGWDSRATRQHINRALNLTSAGANVYKAKGRLLLCAGGALREWNGNMLTFRPKQSDTAHGTLAESYRVAYSTKNHMGEKTRENLFVRAKDKLSALIIARTQLPPEAKIYGAYSLWT
jgi:hypothetical protein